jgi:hypothetical protein
MMDENRVREIIKTEIEAAMAVHVYEQHKRRSSGAFQPPTRQEVENYAREKKLALSIDKFLDFYECKGWMVGRSKMKDWKAAARRAVNDGWGWTKNAPWMHETEPKPKKAGPQIEVISYADRVKLREEMGKIGRPVPKL